LDHHQVLDEPADRGGGLLPPALVGDPEQGGEDARGSHGAEDYVVNLEDVLIFLFVSFVDW
jgi:hypothetical protein